MAKEKQNTEQLRAQAALLLSQARSQSADVRRALEAVRGDPALQSELSAAAGELSTAISDLETALQSGRLRAADLMAVRNIVQSGTINALVTQATTQAAAAQSAARTAEIAAASADTRHETESLSHDLFERHIFDKYLRFASPDDEAEYRKREAEARRYIDTQLAKKSPEGDLNAGGGMIGQMLDAHAHGAGASPDFLPRWNALVDKTMKQRAAMHAAGQKTEEFDRNLNTSVRRFLKAKGLSDAEIDAKLASGADPLEAVKPFIGNDHASQELERAAAPVTATELPQVTTVAPPEKSQTVTVDVISARLKAAGVQMTSDTPADKDGHGLPQQARQRAGTAPALPG